MSVEATVQFSSGSLIAMNVILATMILGVSLSLKPDDFKRVLRRPKAPVVGLVAQFMLLPGFTCFATWALRIEPSMALGMILVAACPGGTFSNVMTFIARGSVATSISMTAVSSLAAIIMTPLNFAFYGSLNPYTRPVLQDIAMEPLYIVALFVLVIGLPLALGMTLGQRFKGLAGKVEKPFRNLSVLALFVFVGIGIHRNLDQLLSIAGFLIAIVALHNLFSLGIGFISGKVSGLSEPDLRAVTLETGIQNSGLALSVLFTFYPDQGAMILVAALWGVWHLISGLGLSLYWSVQSNAHFTPLPELTDEH